MTMDPAISGLAAPAEGAVRYHDTVVRQFSLMAVVWGVVGMLVGLFVAAQLHLTGAHRAPQTIGGVE